MAQGPTQSRPHPLGQSHSEIGKCSSNPGPMAVAARQWSVKLGPWASKLGPRTTDLGSGKVAGKVLIVDHM